VLISIDTLAPRRMSVYGGPRENTPAIEALARRGVRFSNAFSPSPWTLPAHAAMLTGLYPSSMAPDDNDLRLYHLAPLLSMILRREGYQTGAVVGGAYVSAAFGADRDFDSFKEGNIDDGIAWIDEDSTEPFFFFFHTYNVHAPYSDQRYVDSLNGGRVALSRTPLQRLLTYLTLCCRPFQPTWEEREYIQALYDGEVAAADEMVGEIVSALSERGLLARTVVIVTSDHGEEFWEHTGRGAIHGHSLYDELLRVPLIWYEPGLPNPGRTVEEAVSLIDLVPTLVARLHVTAPPAQFDGVNLGDLLDGRPFDVNRALFGGAVAHGPERFSVRTGEGKLILTPDNEVQRGVGVDYPVPVGSPLELYMADDPAEKRNQAGDRPELVAKLLGQLEAHREAGAREEPLLPAITLDAKTREQLHALGYFQ
jgi:arylsulfatase A-like enzyme